MVGIIEGAKESPRFDDEKDILYWYAGDAFTVTWVFKLLDEESGEIHEYAPDDRMFFTFHDAKKHLVHMFECVDIQGCELQTNFTPEISMKFKPGFYTYCVKYNWIDEETGEERVQTIIDNKRVIVEACH